MSEQTQENADVQAAIDAIADTGRKAAVEAQPIKPLGGAMRSQTQTSVTIPGDVGTNALGQEYRDRLTKTRSAIQGLTNEIDADMAEMNRLWKKIGIDRETLGDLKRAEESIMAGITDLSKPAFQR